MRYLQIQRSRLRIPHSASRTPPRTTPPRSTLSARTAPSPSPRATSPSQSSTSRRATRTNGASQNTSAYPPESPCATTPTTRTTALVCGASSVGTAGSTGTFFVPPPGLAWRLDTDTARICALKHSDGGQREERWWEWVENVWPIVAGVVAWEVEEYSACCLRNE